MKPSFTLNSNNNVGQLLVSFQFINLQLKCSRADILKVEIASTCIEGSVATKPSLCKVENDCNLNYQWNSDQIPLLSPIIDDLEQLEEQHLLLSVYNDALESLGWLYDAPFKFAYTDYDDDIVDDSDVECNDVDDYKHDYDSVAIIF
ncbi:hypothetical protein HELRODRAFT_174414 [Helobdella robusta]|uniref:Phosphatidylinositol 3,4,5-trisphosphate 5-phosphatase 1/2-like second C2 domain-containing protein n=1 Tax=Helobdella robusta TaxID=6412 RepID=T1F837_HELRO|nr:hypothetical protein HELRODRAFT_174414 [Helobdella robusta]ESO02938.1 hypothetical protein HELRODRAFT_174414 [Helobdella robusta]